MEDESTSNFIVDIGIGSWILKYFFIINVWMNTSSPLKIQVLKKHIEKNVKGLFYHFFVHAKHKYTYKHVTYPFFPMSTHSRVNNICYVPFLCFYMHLNDGKSGITGDSDCFDKSRTKLCGRDSIALFEHMFESYLEINIEIAMKYLAIYFWLSR